MTSTRGSQALTMTYDANGNLCAELANQPTVSCNQAGANTYTYDAENRMKSRGVTGGSMTYTYDAGGTMVKRTNADGSATVYIGGIFEKTFNPSGIATGTTKYYSALGRTIAARTETSGGAGMLSYLLADHLGSTVAALNTSGGVVANSPTKYWPYGATRSGGTASPQPTDQMYTGQRLEPGGDALGLYNYKARMYSAVTGRFVSGDAFSNAPLDPQSLSPYSYVRNNPLSMSDPTGNCFTFFGEKLQCEQKDVLAIVRCGMAMDGCGGNKWWLSFVALQMDEFWDNAASKMREGGQVNIPGYGRAPLDAAIIYSMFGAASEHGLTDAVSTKGWSEIGISVGFTNGSYFHASFDALAYGLHGIAALTDGDIYGQSNPLMTNALLGVLAQAGVDFGLPNGDNLGTALDDWHEKTIGAARRLGAGLATSGMLWSPEQRALIRDELKVDPKGAVPGLEDCLPSCASPKR